MKKNPFENFGENKKQKTIKIKPKEIDKSLIFDELNRDTTGMLTFSKTGKEIKEQILNVVVPNLKESYEGQIDLINEVIPKMGDLPTEDFSSYRIKIDMPYKKYNWDEMQIANAAIESDEDNSVSVPTPDIFLNFTDSEDQEINKINLAADKDQAEARKIYNQLLNGLYDLLIDSKTCNILLNNLKDSDTYNLTVGQSAALLF